MRITHLVLENWRNFRNMNIPLQNRVFVIGPNAAGKSNLLDAIRFLRDIAEPEGGFQRAIKARGGVSQVRCLHARQQSGVAIGVEVELPSGRWEYKLEFSQDKRRAVIRKEIVRLNGESILLRPDEMDKKDPSRLTQTNLEQVNANKEFRGLAEFFSQVRYLHIVPQMIKDPERGLIRHNDPFGTDFLEQIARTPKKTLQSRLRRINMALQVAVPQLRQLDIERDERGVPHLKGLYEHWRPNAGWQTEEHFSDGTLRLLGLLWALLDGDTPLLLEEPELSLHVGIVRHIPTLMARTSRRGRQVLISTHSQDLLQDKGISAQEVILLRPSADGTIAEIAADDARIMALMKAGIPVGEAAMPYTAPSRAGQLVLFGS